MSHPFRAENQLPDENMVDLSQLPPTSTTSEAQIPIQEGSIFGDRFKLIAPIGVGGFGTVWAAEDRQLRDVAAVKVGDESAIVNEIESIQLLQGLLHVPVLRASSYNPPNRFLAMDRFETSLYDRWQSSPFEKKRFGLRTTTLLALQMIDALNEIHTRGLYHGDVKSKNTMINSHNLCILIDYGESRVYKNIETQTWRKYRHIGGFRGTGLYGSSNALGGFTCGPIDDLVSMLYTLVEMRTGSLPWSDLERAEMIELKKQTSPQKLFSTFPSEYMELAELIFSTEYGKTADYERMKTYLKSVLSRMPGDDVYDWDNDFREVKIEENRQNAV